MGGKNPLIVLEDASPSLAASLSLQGAMGMAGQRCTATSRVILVGEAHDGFLRALHAQLPEWRVGHPLDSATTIGPVISAPQRDKILAAIESGRGAGRLVHGGGIPDDPALDHGHFIEPTVFDDVDPDAALAQDEIFGPVMAVIRAGSISEAVALANGTRYGLSASVCTQDLGAALQLIEALDFGVIHINRATPAIERYAPFGGMKNSGSGSREQGRAAREFFTEWKTVYIASEHGEELGDKEAT
jgi:aldehyde dehydrogenase (NAD+)